MSSKIRPVITALSVNYKGKRYSQEKLHHLVNRFTVKHWKRFPFHQEMKSMFDNFRVSSRTMHLDPGDLYLDQAGSSSSSSSSSNNNNLIKDHYTARVRNANSSMILESSVATILKARLKPSDIRAHVFHSTFSKINGVKNDDPLTHYHTDVNKQLGLGLDLDLDLNLSPNAGGANTFQSANVEPAGCSGGIEVIKDGIEVIKDGIEYLKSFTNTPTSSSLSSNNNNSKSKPPIVLITNADLSSQLWGGGMNKNYRDLIIRASTIASDTNDGTSAGNYDVLMKEHLGKMKSNWMNLSAFGDGSASAIITTFDHFQRMNALNTMNGGRQPSLIGAEIITSSSHLCKNSEGLVRLYNDENGIHAIVSPKLSSAIKVEIKEVIDSFLTENNIRFDQINHWVIHPGGPKILTTIQQELKLPASALKHSFDSLKQNGNVVGTSIFDVLDRTMTARANKIKSGNLCMMIAMGPEAPINPLGSKLKINILLLKFC